MAHTLGSTINKLLEEVNRVGQYTSQASGYINDAIEHYQDRPFKFNEQIATTNTQNGEEYLDLPPDWGEEYLISIDYRGDGHYHPLNYRTMEEMEELFVSSNDYTGQPVDYTIFRQQIRLGPIPDTNTYSVKMAYRVRPDTATAASQTNTFIQNANELIRGRAGRNLAALYMHDDAIAGKMAALEAEALQRLTSENTRYAMRGHAKRRR